MEQKDKIKLILKQIGVTIAVIIIIMILNIAMQKTDKIQLTQLSPQGSSQMMGYLIKTRENKIIAIDGGTTEDTNNWIQKVKQLGGKVDNWFITHPHQDHASVFNEIVTNHPEIEIGTIYYTANPVTWYQENEPERAFEAERFYNTIQNERIKNKAKEVELNQKIKIDNVDCEILGIKNPEITKNAFNNSSMVIKMKINNQSILFLGDTGEESGQKLLQNQKEKLKSDIVQMAHHGQAGVTKEVYKEIKPQICLWPTPEWLWDNDRGEGYNTASYKTIETRQWVNELKVEQNIIAKDGDKTIEIK